MLLRPKEVCERLGITYGTLRDYVKRGWIKPVILESGRWRFREEDVDRLMGVAKPKITILYARVSSHDQKEDLDRQIKALERWARENNIVNYEIITDIGSGLDEDRKGFKKILELAAEKKISKIVITHPDRLTRFGFKTISKLLEAFGTTIEVISQEEKTPREELVEDLITIVSHFAGKLYGRRSHKYVNVVEGVRKLVEDP